VLPTPAIAFAASTLRAPALIVSASHNPWNDNGVKIIGADGRKVSDDIEAAIEQAIPTPPRSTAPTTGRRIVETVADAYVTHLLAALGGRSLAGLYVVLDCANGAGYDVAPRALREAGARVDVIHADPDGININADCGSTHPESLQAAVRTSGADIGLALDGDADRVIAVDERGEIVDGDQIMTMTALDLHARGLLDGNTIVVTVMSNIGLRRALTAVGIDVVETPVGDRHVLAAMQERGLVMGGEQSGHIVYRACATTGDGTLTGLLVCDLVQRAQRPLSALAAQMTRYPQLLVNVRVAQRVDLDHAEPLWKEVRSVERTLGPDGRVLVRASGTEPVVRVMVEATSEAVARAAVARLTDAVESVFGSM
jgi:phosphoglucosamine mutase